MQSKLSFFTLSGVSEKECYNIFCNQGLFILALGENKSQSFGALIEGDLITNSMTQDFLQKVSQTFSSTSGVKLKLIGLAKLIAHFKNDSLVKNLTVFKEVVKQGSFELIYNPRDGRLQLSKDNVQSADDNSKNNGYSENTEPSVKRKIKVLIVDDSSTIRQLLTKIFSSDPDMEVVGQAELPSQVEGLIKKTSPDVVTLDIHMPEMDGVTLLKKLILKYPLPYVMVSAISMEEGPMVLDALGSGAVDYIQKPTMKELPHLAPMIIERIKIAANAKVQQNSGNLVTQSGINEKINQNILIAFGSSTGGTEALRQVLTGLPANIPPIVITQHIPPVFSKSFADRLNELCTFEVKEAEDGDDILPNRVLIAPGATQMSVINGGKKVKIDSQAEPVNRHKPSVDVLFNSVSKEVGKKSIGIILTGMGSDGARGLLSMKQKGAKTIAQNQESCVVFGMPREAIALGAALEICHLNQVASKIVDWLSTTNTNSGKAA